MANLGAARPMGGYLMQFALYYASISVVIALGLNLLNIEANRGVSIATTMVSALLVAQRFYADNERVMNKRERITAVLGSLLLSLLVFVLTAVAFFSFLAGGIGDGLNMLKGLFLTSMPLSLWFLVSAVVVLVHAAILWFSYGYLARRIAEKSQR